MAKVTLNKMIEAIQGELHGYIFRSLPDGTVVLAKRPNMSQVRWSKAQKAQRQRMKKAVAYAHAALADPAVSLHYQKAAKKRKMRPFNLAVSDYFKGRNLLENRP